MLCHVWYLYSLLPLCQLHISLFLHKNTSSNLFSRKKSRPQIKCGKEIYEIAQFNVSHSLVEIKLFREWRKEFQSTDKVGYFWTNWVIAKINVVPKMKLKIRKIPPWSKKSFTRVLAQSCYFVFLFF